VNGRKRHLLVDTEGLVVRVVVLPADIQDRDGAQDLCHVAAPVCPRLERLWADHAYTGALVAWVREEYGWRLEIVSKPPDQAGFAVQPRRWVVERTFAWLSTYRRLSKDYEELPDSSEAWIYAASIHLMLRRLVPGDERSGAPHSG
jgi:putative transposase